MQGKLRICTIARRRRMTVFAAHALGACGTIIQGVHLAADLNMQTLVLIVSKNNAP